MRKTLLFLLPAALLALMLLTRRDPEVEVPAEPAAGEAVHGNARMRASVESAATTTGERAPDLLDREVVTDPNRAVITGRLIAPETGQPLAGGVVRLRGSWQQSRGYPASERPDWPRPEAVTTGADGRFEFPVPGHPAFSFRLEATATGRTRLTALRTEVGPGERADLGDAPMSIGTIARGRVVDENGIPLAGVRVDFIQRRLSGVLLGSWAMYPMVSFETDADGSFATREAMTRGTWRVRGQREAAVDPEQIHVVEGQAFTDVEIVLQAEIFTGRIGGFLVDEAGEPVPRHIVYARTADGTGVGAGRSGADGSFVIEQDQPHDGPVFVSARENRFETVGGLREHRWSDMGVRLVVREHPTLRLRVVAAESGDPVEDYGIRFSGPDSGSFPPVIHRGHHTGGLLEIPRVGPEPHTLHVLPTGDEYAATEPLTIQIDRSNPEVVVELRRRIPVGVRVELRDGSPVSGSSVEMIRVEGGSRISLTTKTGTPEEAYSTFSSTGAIGVILDEGVTDQDGYVAVTGAPTGTLILKLKGPGHIPMIHELSPLVPNAAPVVVRVSQGATVVGVLEPGTQVRSMLPDPEALQRADGLHDQARVDYLERLGPRIDLTPAVQTQGLRFRTLVDDEGRFRIEGIPPGDVRVRLYFQRKIEGVLVSRNPELAPIAALRDGETRQLRLDISHLASGRLSGVVLLDGEPHRGEFTLNRADVRDAGFGDQYAAGLSTDEHGAFECDVEPGFYWVVVRYGIDANRRFVTIMNPEPVLIEPEQVTDHVFAVNRATLRVRVLENDGSPAVQRILEPYTPTYIHPEELAPDDEGRFTLTVAAGVPVRFFTWPKGLNQQSARESVGLRQEFVALSYELGTFEVPKGELQAEFTVTLPPGK